MNYCGHNDCKSCVDSVIWYVVKYQRKKNKNKKADEVIQIYNLIIYRWKNL